MRTNVIADWGGRDCYSFRAIAKKRLRFVAPFFGPSALGEPPLMHSRRDNVSLKSVRAISKYKLTTVYRLSTVGKLTPCHNTRGNPVDLVECRPASELECYPAAF
jgi:hypothetical protein